MTRRTELDPRHVGVPLPARELREHGIPRSRVRARDTSRPFRGIHLVGATAESTRERAVAFAPLLRPGDAFSHSTAAHLLGAPLPGWAERESRLHVVSLEAERFRRRGVIGHRASGLRLVHAGNLPVVAAEQVWLQLATVLSLDDLVAAGDFFVTGVRGAQPLASIDALGAALAGWRSRGSARARRALAMVRVGARSRPETHLRLMLVRAGLPEPAVAPPVRVGGRVLHPDLAYARWRVAFEYEGDHHRTDQQQWRHDLWRREAFEDAGWRVIRVHAGDLAEREAFFARVCRILAQRPVRD